MPEQLASIRGDEMGVTRPVPAPAVPVTVLGPSKGVIRLDLREMWEYRELLYFLIWRDVKVRYKQATLGVAWAIIQPLMTMLIFSVIFGQLAGLPSDGIPYPVFSFAALLPWQLFAGSVQRAGTSLVGNSNLLTKVYFPRLVIPLSAVAAGLVDFGLSFLVLLGLMAYYGVRPTWAVVWLPFLILLALTSALAVGLWLAALNVQYRDVQHIIPFLIQAWMYASPVTYSANLVPAGKWKLIFGLNPLAGVIQGFRWALFGGQPPQWLLAISVAMVLALLASGLAYFRHMEATFADVV